MHLLANEGLKSNMYDLPKHIINTSRKSIIFKTDLHGITSQNNYICKSRIHKPCVRKMGSGGGREWGRAVLLFDTKCPWSKLISRKLFVMKRVFFFSVWDRLCKCGNSYTDFVITSTVQIFFMHPTVECLLKWCSSGVFFLTQALKCAGLHNAFD